MEPLDLAKFRTAITKNISGISTGFNDPVFWINTGNLTLNYLISGDFNRGVPLGKFTLVAGESGAGKSFFCSGNIARYAQEDGVHVVLLDSENALDEKWLNGLGVDTSPEKLIRIGVSSVDNVAKTLYTFMEDYKDNYGHVDYVNQPKVLFVIDSLGMLTTPAEEEQYKKGDMKGDMGRKAKQLTQLVKNTVNLIANHPVGIVATNHIYSSQDMYDREDKISGGQGLIFASSIVVLMNKSKLKDDKKGATSKDISGILSRCKVLKTRYAKPFESVEIKIPYAEGMNKYSGLFEFFEKAGMIIKNGNRYKYFPFGDEEKCITKYKKDMAFDAELMSQMMEDFEQQKI